MSIVVRFRCQHSMVWPDTQAAPVCPICGEQRISSVTAPAPTFRGAAKGPCAKPEDLPAIPLNLKGSSA